MSVGETPPTIPPTLAPPPHSLPHSGSIRGCDFVGECRALIFPGGWGALAGEGGESPLEGALGLPACRYLLSGNREAAAGGPGLGCSDVLTIARLRNPAAASAPGLTVLAFQGDFITLERAREPHVTN